MRTVVFLLLAVPACSAFGGGRTIESSVVLAANGKATTTMRGDPSLSVRLRGLGPGGVKFDARTPTGSLLAHGLLTPESSAECQTSEGELVITFVADARGGSIAYSLGARDGGSVTTIPQ